MSGATYCTLGQFGFGAWIDVKCTSEPTEDGGILHWLHFVLVGGPNQDTLGMGEVYVTQHDPAKPEVYSDMFDEDEDRFFPDIDAAIQGHLAWMTEVDLTPGPRVSRAPRHNMGCGVFKAAFGEVA